MVVMAGYRLRGRRFDSHIGFLFTPLFIYFFFCLIISFHTRSTISMLNRFSSNESKFVKYRALENNQLYGICVIVVRSLSCYSLICYSIYL